MIGIVQIRREDYGWSELIGEEWAPLPFTPMATLEQVTTAIRAGYSDAEFVEVGVHSGQRSTQVEWLKMR